MVLPAHGVTPADGQQLRQANEERQAECDHCLLEKDEWHSSLRENPLPPVRNRQISCRRGACSPANRKRVGASQREYSRDSRKHSLPSLFGQSDNGPPKYKRRQK